MQRAFNLDYRHPHEMEEGGVYQTGTKQNTDQNKCSNMENEIQC